MSSIIAARSDMNETPKKEMINALKALEISKTDLETMSRKELLERINNMDATIKLLGEQGIKT